MIRPSNVSRRDSGKLDVVDSPISPAGEGEPRSKSVISSNCEARRSEAVAAPHPYQTKGAALARFEAPSAQLRAASRALQPGPREGACSACYPAVRHEAGLRPGSHPGLTKTVMRTARALDGVPRRADARAPAARPSRRVLRQRDRDGDGPPRRRARENHMQDRGACSRALCARS